MANHSTGHSVLVSNYPTSIGKILTKLIDRTKGDGYIHSVISDTQNTTHMIKITEKPIDIPKVIETASSLGAGAVNVFIGTVRNTAHNKNVVWLEYEAYESMAVNETRKIIDEAAHRWPLMGWAVSHRVGTLKPGEVAVVVAVSTKHRKESFEACQYIIDRLKENVPIFKKEVFEDGEEWVGARPQTATSTQLT